MSHRRHSKKYRDYADQRRNGFGVNLYRNTRDGKIGGVCAGLADHFGISHWVMRILAISALWFTGGVAFWLYVVAWIALSSERPEQVEESMEYDEQAQCYRRKNVLRYPAPSGERIKRARERMDSINARVSAMEEYVTSRKYKLDQEFSKL